MTEKYIITYKEQLKLQNDIIRQMTKDHFLPDVIVGVSRGGLPIGVMLSHYYDTPFVPFKGSIRDHPNWETNWKLPSHWQIKNGKKRIGEKMYVYSLGRFYNATVCKSHFYDPESKNVNQ